MSTTDLPFSDFLIIGLKYYSGSQIESNLTKSSHKGLKYSTTILLILKETLLPISKISIWLLSYINYFKMCMIPPISFYSLQLEPILYGENYNKNGKTKKIIDIKSKNYLHQFIITDSLGFRRYCTSLIIYEKCLVTPEPIYLPFAYCIVSLKSNLVKQKTFLHSIYNTIFDQTIRNYNRGIVSPVSYDKQLSFQEILQGAKLESKHEKHFFPHCILLEYYLSIAFSLNESLKSPIQIFIPQHEQSTNKKQETKQINFLSITHKNCDLFATENDISFRCLFQRLSFENIVKLIQCLLLEKQIIFFTEYTWELATVTEALLSLLYPLQTYAFIIFVREWRCIYIPYLPQNLLETLHATTPYIIGLNSNLKTKVLSQIDCFDKVIVYLDEDRITGANLFCGFPEFVNDHLLKECKTMGLEKLKDKQFEFSMFVSFRIILLKHFIQLINNFIPFFTYGENLEKNYKLNDIFDKDSYLSIFDQNDFYFYNEFITRTMMFQRFIEESYRLLHQTDFLKNQIQDIYQYKIHYFIQAVKRVKNTFDGHINILNNPHLFSGIQFELSQQLLKANDLEQNSDSLHCGSFMPIYLSQIDSSLMTKKTFPLMELNKDIIKSLTKNGHFRKNSSFSVIQPPVSIQKIPMLQLQRNQSLSSENINGSAGRPFLENLSLNELDEKKRDILLCRFKTNHINISEGLKTNEIDQFQVRIILLQQFSVQDIISKNSLYYFKISHIINIQKIVKWEQYINEKKK